MFRNILALIFFVSAACFAGLQENYNGYGDTAVVEEFNADSFAYTKPFKLSAFENLRVTLALDDTSNAGFSGDSCFAIWGVQTGHPIYNADGSRDTLWNPLHIVADTFDLITDPTIGPAYELISVSDNLYNDVQGLIDTLSVTGYAVQTKNISAAWDVFFRGWIQGATGNKVGSYVKALFTVLQRQYQKNN